MRFKKLVYQSVVWRGFYFCTVLLLNVLVSRYLQASGSGWLFYLSNWYAFIVLAMGTGLEYGFGFFVSSGKISSRKLANFSLVYITLISILMAFGFRAFFPEDNATRHSWFMLICYVSGNLLINFFAALLYVRRNFFLPNVVFSFFNLLLTAWILIPALQEVPVRAPWGLDFNTVYFGNFLVQGLVITGCYYFLEKRTGGTILPSFRHLAMLIRYAGSILILHMALFLAFRLDSWIIAYYCSPDDLGNYIQVTKLVQVFMILPAILASAIFPVSAGSQNNSNLASNVQTVSRVLTLLFLSGCILLTLTGYWLFPWVYGPSFSSMYVVFLFLIPGILSLNVLTLLNAYFAGKNQVRINIYGALVSLCIIIGGDLLLIPRYGIPAAAIVSSAGYLCNAIFALYYFRQLYPHPLKDFFMVRKADIGQLTGMVKRR